MHDSCACRDNINGSVSKSCCSVDDINVSGRFVAECRDAYGNLKWSDEIKNLVTDEAKKFTLDLVFGTGTFSSVYMGLVSSVGYSAVAKTDTAAEINGTNGWKEAGSGSNYPIIASREVPAFSAAVKNTDIDKATSSPLAFLITGTGGTVKGAFIVINGTSAVGNTTGKLYCAGLFATGDKILSTLDTISISYTTSITA